MHTETALDLLSHQYRRAIVDVLHETSPLSRPELTARLVTRVADENSRIGRSDDEVRRRVRIRLHHNHLPKLADAGAVEYDDESVAATPELETLASHLSDHYRGAPVSPTSIDEQLAQFYA